MKKLLLSTLLAGVSCYGFSQVLHVPVNNNIDNQANGNFTLQKKGALSYLSGQDGASKGAFCFPYTNSFLSSSNFKGLGDKAFTVALWYKNKVSSDHKGLLIKTGRKSDERQLFSIEQRKHSHNDSISLLFYVYEKDVRTTSLDPWRPLWFKVNLDKGWHHIAMTGEAGDKVAIYIDGQLKASKSVTQTSFSFAPETLLIGHGDDSYDNRMGVFDDIRIYNKVISKDLLNRIYARVDGEGAELEEESINVSSLAKLPVEDPEEAMADHDTEMSVPLPDEDPSDRVASSDVLFNPETGKFTSIADGQAYFYTLPNSLQYKSHKFTGDKVVVEYYKPSTKQNYIGVWNRKLEYQGEYNFANIRIQDYTLQSDDQEGLIMIHYNDPAHNSSFVGVFSNKAAYLGQYSVTNTTNVSMTFRNEKIYLGYTYQGKSYQVEIDQRGKELSRNTTGNGSKPTHKKGKW